MSQFAQLARCEPEARHQFYSNKVARCTASADDISSKRNKSAERYMQNDTINFKPELRDTAAIAKKWCMRARSKKKNYARWRPTLFELPALTAAYVTTKPFSNCLALRIGPFHTCAHNL